MENTRKKCALGCLAAFILLSSMAVIMLYEATTHSTIVDESPHIVAGYAYVAEKDYRLNPEHPPLIKMLSALPLAFQDINFPFESSAWQNDVNGQWQLGTQFLFESGNNPDSLMFWGRLGPILITLLLGFLIFKWAKELYGSMAGLFAVTLFSFSPTFLAHGPLITTDVGAAFAFFLATYYFFKYLKKQTKRNLIWAGLAFGTAQLMKFSLIILIPYFTLVALMWILFKDKPMGFLSAHTLKRVGVYFGKLIMLGIIGMILVFPLYQYTVWDYPPERQVSDTAYTLDSSAFGPIADGVVWMADKPVLRAYAQFFLGHLMVLQRVAGGNTTYFLGEVSSVAWPEYFPLVFALKVPVALLFLIIMSVAIVVAAKYRKYKISISPAQGIKEKFKKSWRVFMEWGDTYFTELAFGLFILIYWGLSILGNLNIGVRHVLPTLPFMYLLIAGALHKWVHHSVSLDGLTVMDKVRIFTLGAIKKWARMGVVIVLLLWYTLSSLSVFPHYLAYFNGLAGGPDNGYKYVVDSNLDWGQDLKRLTTYAEQNNIQNIKLDYFGGGSPTYYLSNKYEKLDARNESQRKGWIAVSATLLQNGRGVATKGFQSDTTYYSWLNKYEPVAKAGYSIFIYHIN
ncbi:MAG: glycosyltransferase family 39 protein [Candidatus Spechtbacterales bacterium]